MTTTATVLLVSTSTRWIGTARIPRGLARAGFDVALLTPRNSLAEKSRFVARIAFLPDVTTPHQWVSAFAGTVRATAPRIVVPCDDMAFNLLQTLVLAPPHDLQSALQLELSLLIRASLGEPAYFRASIDKTLLPAAAAALGVRVPAFRNVAAIGEAETFAREHGYPVVLKRSHGFAGNGVAICADAGELGAAWRRLRVDDPQVLGAGAVSGLLVQAFVHGATVSRSTVAWQGRQLAGTTRERLVQNPPESGPGSVVRYFHQPEVARLCSTLIEGFGMTGFSGIEFRVEQGTGLAYLLEINRRVTPGASTSDLAGIDLCAALHAAVTGTASTVPFDVAPGTDRIIARFPQEWLRDPASPNLNRYPVDAPWDDPGVFEAMLAMRHDT
jgi:glutathione synthase/RimK-type ligase-like ATP-grasp enzyme